MLLICTEPEKFAASGFKYTPYSFISHVEYGLHLGRYYSFIARNMVRRFNDDRLIYEVTQEDLLFIRMELLTYYQSLKKGPRIRYRRAYQSRHMYACWSLAAGVYPNFLTKQMGHTDAQMVYRVYGSWMAENNQDQVLILNQKLSEFAPSMPQTVGSDGY